MKEKSKAPGAKPAPGAPGAGELANPNWRPNCWRTLGVDETPQPGDVGAYPLTGGGRDFSGHSGIITLDGSISAHDDGVSFTPGDFGPARPGRLFRR